MLPGFQAYLRRYRWLLGIFCVILMMSCVLSVERNIVDISLGEMLFVLGSICVSLVYAVVRDSRGYWFYVLMVRKTFDPEEKRTQLAQTKFGPVATRLFQSPANSAALALVFVALVCIPGYSVFHSSIYVFIAGFGLVAVPAFVLFMATGAAWVQARNVLAHVANPVVPAARGVWIGQIVGMDLLFTVAINLALVLPIERTPAFSLEHGYASREFIGAFLVLMWIVYAYLIVFSCKSRRFVLIGELLIGAVNEKFVRPALGERRFFRKRNGWRYAVCAIGIGIWSVAACVFFDRYGGQARFAPLYLSALVPLLLLYAIERFNVLRHDFRDAVDARDRLAVIASTKVAQLTKMDS